ncbi:MAG: hypothetical protein IKG58_03700 [Bacilli bacterium]|nr:hypothetical protein [Bacilli bacterium]MBR3049641.1 hypothetical protein [Bacilli bacterium]
MEKFKKVLKFLVNNILFIAILLLIFSVTLNKVITKDLLTDFLIQKVSNETTEVLDKNFNELDKEDINKINNDIKTNKDVNNLIEKYARNTIEVMSENNTYDMNLLDDAKAVIKANKNILRDEYKINVTDKQIDEAVDKLDKEYKLNDYYNNLVKQTSNNLSKEQKDALKLYKFITSTKLMIILSIIIIVLLIAIAIYKKSFYKWLKNLSISSITSSILNIIAFISITLVINTSMKDFKLQMIKSIEIPLCFLVGSLLLLTIYKIIDLKIKRNTK